MLTPSHGSPDAKPFCRLPCPRGYLRAVPRKQIRAGAREVPRWGRRSAALGDPIGDTCASGRAGHADPKSQPGFSSETFRVCFPFGSTREARRPSRKQENKRRGPELLSWGSASGTDVSQASGRAHTWPQVLFPALRTCASPAAESSSPPAQGPEGGGGPHTRLRSEIQILTSSWELPRGGWGTTILSTTQIVKPVP